MKKIPVLGDLSALRALSDPLRKEIVRLLQREPRTAFRFAALLGEKARRSATTSRSWNGTVSSN
jgi:hypothetical protein